MLRRTIASAYRIVELTGVGGMGRVYRAEQLALGRSVAIKVIHPQLSNDDLFAERFYQEARAASALNHPNTVSVIDFGRTEDGMHYLVMEYLQGQDLSQVLLAGPLSIARACAIGVDMLSALSEAHVNGIVHRDIKPENLFVEHLRSGRDVVKVLDFGIAKLATERSTTSTHGDELVGTPEYMSPEQVRGEPVDGRSDLYATGVVLYELLTGKVPFLGASPQQTMRGHLELDATPPRQLRADIPPVLERVVLRALQKRPADRFESAADMAAALSEVVESLGLRRAVTPLPHKAARTAESPFVGRRAELDRLERALRAARSGPAFVHLVGEAGSGKSRLARKLAEIASSAGFVAFECGPHPSHTKVAYHAVRELLRALLQTDDAGLLDLGRSSSIADPFVRAGILEVVSPESVPHSARCNLASAVARALVHAVHAAQQPRLGVPLLLTVEDAHLLDAASLRALRALAADSSDPKVCVCVTSAHALRSLLPEGTEVVEVTGLSAEEARAYVGADSGVRLALRAQSAPVLPLYVDEVRQLGLEETDLWPRELAQAVSERVRRCSRGAQRLLQLASVLGVSCARGDLEAMAQGRDLASLDELRLAQLLTEQDGVLAFTHPHTRDLVHASLPAATRSGLHAQALKLSDAQAAPLEVRAYHASESSDVMTACGLLERVGTRALRCGDHAAAIETFRRGWELARERAARAFDPVLASAIAAMGRGLARAMFEAGETTGAEGLLMEQLDLWPPKSLQHAKVAVELAALLVRRGDATRARLQLERALEVARATRSGEAEARTYALQGKLAIARGDLREAVQCLQRAFDLAAHMMPVFEQAEIALALGAALARQMDLAGASMTLSHVEASATAAGAWDLAARAVTLLGLIERTRRNGTAAKKALERARDLAARAGDLDFDQVLSGLGDADLDSPVGARVIDVMLRELG
jgi:serine/threonine-protein kinase